MTTTNQMTLISSIAPTATTYFVRGVPCRATVDPSGSMFVAAVDVAGALGLSVSGSDFVRGLPDGTVSTRTIQDAMGRAQDTVCLSMEGVLLVCARAKGEAGREARAALVSGLVEAQRRLSEHPPAVVALFRRARSVHRDAINLGLLPRDAPLPTWIGAAGAPVPRPSRPALPRGMSSDRVRAATVEFLSTASGFQTAERIRAHVRTGATRMREFLTQAVADGTLIRGQFGGYALNKQQH